jgi:hypothetical protein
MHLNVQDDELHLNVGDYFWVEWFPRSNPAVADRFMTAVLGLLSGDCHVVESSIRGRVVSARLECLNANGSWRRLATWADVRALIPVRRQKRILDVVRWVDSTGRSR